MSDLYPYSLRAAWSAEFDGEPTVLASAPGRVELLGNHTDYNGGLVLAAAIDRRTMILGRAKDGRTATVRSANIGEMDRFSIDGLRREDCDGWRRYVRGVTWASGPLADAFEAAILGEIPIGAGLSSSASLQAAFALFLARAGLVDLPGALDETADDASRMALAQLLRKSENEFVGVASGLLDQFSVLFGKANHALVLDCRSLEHARVPLGNPAPAIVICDSATSRRLADGMYNIRRSECEQVVEHFRSKSGGESVTCLRDISLERLLAEWDALDPVARRRARHVLTENDRVLAGREALIRGDVSAFGALMTDSHASSRDDFENSSPALDALIESAQAAPGFLGGKLSGAGWAGCTVNLVEADRVPAFGEAVREQYMRRTGLHAQIYPCRADDGATAISLV